MRGPGESYTAMGVFPLTGRKKKAVKTGTGIAMTLEHKDDDDAIRLSSGTAR